MGVGRPAAADGEGTAPSRPSADDRGPTCGSGRRGSNWPRRRRSGEGDARPRQRPPRPPRPRPGVQDGGRPRDSTPPPTELGRGCLSGTACRKRCAAATAAPPLRHPERRGEATPVGGIVEKRAPGRVRRAWIPSSREAGGNKIGYAQAPPSDTVAGFGGLRRNAPFSTGSSRSCKSGLPR